VEGAIFLGVQQTLAVRGVTLLKEHANGETAKYEDLAGKIRVRVRRTKKKLNVIICQLITNSDNICGGVYGNDVGIPG
jgi:hypothetical protein